MRWRPTARFLSLVLALPVLIGPTVNARSGQPGPASRVRVWTFMTGPIDPAVRDGSTRVADALLEPAGVSVDWHPCDGPGACARGDVTAPSVTVILMSGAPRKCGLTAFAPDGRSATVMVSVPCVADTTLDSAAAAATSLAPAPGDARGAARPRRRPGPRDRPRPRPEARRRGPHARAPRDRRRHRPPGRAARLQSHRGDTNAGLAPVCARRRTGAVTSSRRPGFTASVTPPPRSRPPISRRQRPSTTPARRRARAVSARHSRR